MNSAITCWPRQLKEGAVKTLYLLSIGEWQPVTNLWVAHVNVWRARLSCRFDLFRKYRRLRRAEINGAKTRAYLHYLLARKRTLHDKD